MGDKKRMAMWTPEKAWTWYESVPTPFGCNFLPSSAVNSTDMWQRDTFDLPTIRRELGLAAGIGYTSVRVFLPFIVWRNDGAGFRNRLEVFLDEAAGARISVMPVLFDDCSFGNREPSLGDQGEPIRGVHNSQWTPSPGFDVVDDQAAWPVLEDYVKDLVSAFGRDPRVLVWDIYNEPGNSGRLAKSVPLLHAAYQWAREVDPIQPLTAGAWDDGMDEATGGYLDLADVITFHSYENLDDIARRIESLRRFSRPLICTEWLHRSQGSCFQTHLPLFRSLNVGAYNWGLVTGRTQTNLSWQTLTGDPDPEPAVWQHDMMHEDGKLYDDAEAAVIRDEVGCDLDVEPQEMTAEMMRRLESIGLIRRLAPDAHSITAKPEESIGESIYESDEEFGPHKLIDVIIQREEFSAFATHPDNEEILLIGDPDSDPLFLAIALSSKEELEAKVQSGSLTASDFVVLRCRYNDPDTSFFVMLKNVPHGEAVINQNKSPARFYVTESRDLPLCPVQMRKYRLKVGTKEYPDGRVAQ